MRMSLVGRRSWSLLHHHINRRLQSQSVRWMSVAAPQPADNDDAAARPTETFLTGTTSLYAEEMYDRYCTNPDSVEASWRTYFDTVVHNQEPYQEQNWNRPTIVASPQKTTSSTATSTTNTTPSDSLGVAHLIRAYQVNGHLAANLDPLGMHSRDSFPYRPSNVQDLSHSEGGYPPELTLEYHGFDPAVDLDRPLHFLGRSSGGNKGYLEELAQLSLQGHAITLRKILAQLRKTYCQSGMGVEYMHMTNVDQVNWIRQRVEHPRWLGYDRETKQHIYERLCFADSFETFLAQKFNTTKRFGLDGGEAVVPALKAAIDRASELGVHSFVMGMPHRGRLNVLANVMRKPMPLIFSEFQGTHVRVYEL